ncbi:Uncharacterised protein [uncultured archaeon]|nr:Uncharacterised protein [uncultured archaeon]
MKFKGMLEGLVLSVPLVFGNPGAVDTYAGTDNIPMALTNLSLHHQKSNLNSQDQAFENRVWFNYALFAGEAFLLYTGYSAVRRLLETKNQ